MGARRNATSTPALKSVAAYLQRADSDAALKPSAPAKYKDRARNTHREDVILAR